MEDSWIREEEEEKKKKEEKKDGIERGC